MNSKEYIVVLETMSIGMSRTEKEAIEFAIRKIKKAKKWKRKYLELKEKYDAEYDRSLEDFVFLGVQKGAE